MRPQVYLCLCLVCIAQIAHAQTWNALGNMTGSVTNILVEGDDVYVTGTFTNPSGDPDADYLARWDGNAWHAVVPNAPANISAMIKRGSDFYIGGSFTNLGSHIMADGIARWDGNAWHPLGSGLNGSVNDMAFRGNHLYAVGFFRESFNSDPYFIAYWDESSWNPIGTTMSSNSEVREIEIAEDGKVYVGGSFGAIDGISTRNVAWWDEDGWHPLGNGFYGDMGVNAIAVDGHDVYVGGDGGTGIGSCGIARWNGSEWHSLAGGVSDCIYGDGPWEIAAANGNVYVGGSFNHAGNVPHTKGLAHWNGSAWNALGNPNFESVYSVRAIAIAGDDIYVGGSFLQIADIPNSSFIARWGEPEVVSTSEDVQSEHHNVLTIHPNPTNGVIRYSFGSSVMQMHTLTLTDASGKVMMHEESREPHLNIAHLPAGLYFLHVESPDRNGATKIMKY